MKNRTFFTKEPSPKFLFKNKKKDNTYKRKLKKELSDKKALRKKYKKILQEDNKLVKKIILIFKSKIYKTAKKRFFKLFKNLEELPEEIQKYLKRLSKYLEKEIQHKINKKIPSINNLIECFSRTTLTGKVKKTFKTCKGILNRITLNNMHWIMRCVLNGKN